MASDRMAVLNKLGRFRPPEGRMRRSDYKGRRHRLNLRISGALAHDLAIIKVVTGEAKNTYCERVLQMIIHQKVGELRQAHDEKGWEAVVACASRQRGYGGG